MHSVLGRWIWGGLIWRLDQAAVNLEAFPHMEVDMGEVDLPWVHLELVVLEVVNLKVVDLEAVDLGAILRNA